MIDGLSVVSVLGRRVLRDSVGGSEVVGGALRVFRAPKGDKLTTVDPVKDSVLGEGSTGKGLVPANPSVGATLSGSGLQVVSDVSVYRENHPKL